MKEIFKFMREWTDNKIRLRKLEKFSDDFFEQGLRRRVLKGLKLATGMAGNKIYQKKLRTKYEIEVDGKCNEKKNQMQFIETLIAEMEEKYRIELRKKAILKN